MLGTFLKGAVTGIVGLGLVSWLAARFLDAKPQGELEEDREKEEK